jgi:NAD(P)-dependent dehydrogenase (short-subunit alcohol dehydrogenase family)
VVLVTGASRGVGRETALQYARAGASGVAIVGRTADALAETRDAIFAVEPGAEVLVLEADVREVESAREAVRSVLRRFGKLDILISNAGAITAFTPSEGSFCSFAQGYGLWRSDTRSASFFFFWFSSQSAEQQRPSCVVEHFRGQRPRCLQLCQVLRIFDDGHKHTFSRLPPPNWAPNSAAIPALESTQGYIVAISSVGAQLRWPGASDGCITKHAVNRLIEFIVLGK